MEAGYKQLDVWKKSMQLALDIYETTKGFPDEEKYGLVSQMRRSSVSIPSNIAEGYRRMLPRDYGKFVRIAYGSGAELETQIELSKGLGFIKGESKIDQILSDVMSMLNGLRRSLAESPDVRRTTSGTKV